MGMLRPKFSACGDFSNARGAFGLYANVLHHGGDSNDATCAVVRVICIPLRVKTRCRPSISTVVSCLGRQQNH